MQKKHKLKSNEAAIVTVNIETVQVDEDPQRGPVQSSEEIDYPGRRVLVNPFWNFYDLGTRLRSVAVPSTFENGTRSVLDTSAVNPIPSEYLEYVEILFSSPGTLNQIAGVDVPLGERDIHQCGMDHIQVDPDNLAEILSWDSILLGLNGDLTNPFEVSYYDPSDFETSEDPRPIQNCMPVKHSGTLFNFGSSRPADVCDIEIYKDDTPTGPYGKYIDIFFNTPLSFGERALDLGRSPGIPTWTGLDKWVSRGQERKDHEVWNPQSLVQTRNSVDVDIEYRGRLDMSQRDEEDLNVRIVSSNTYESFDTGDTDNYKITIDPLFSADEVVFKTKAKTKLDFFLKPRWWGYFRNRTYSSTINWHFETYRYPYGDGTYFNMWSGFSASSVNPSGPGYWNISASRLSGVRDNAVSDGTASWTINHVTGEVQVSGIPGGSVSGIIPISIPGHRQGQLNNGSVEVSFTFASSGGPSSGSTSHSIVWTGYGTPYPSSGNPDNWTFGVSEQLHFAIGAHVGRLPAFPRIVDNPFWTSLTNPFGTSSVTYSNGITKTFSSMSLPVIGQLQKVDEEFHLAEVYFRHSIRDPESFLFARSAGTGGRQIKYPPGSGFGPIVTTIPPITYGTRQGASTSATNSVRDTGFSAMSAYVNSALSGSHFRNVTITNNQGSANNTAPNLVPIDVPSGSLCGVIKKEGIKYYVWRKTAVIRRLHDYNRQQIDWDLPSSAVAYINF